MRTLPGEFRQDLRGAVLSMGVTIMAEAFGIGGVCRGAVSDAENRVVRAGAGLQELQGAVSRQGLPKVFAFVHLSCE
jgi:hypothetical protein